MAYVIKRYANRKLYDAQASRYVALEDLQDLIRRGKEIAVVDAVSGEDITAVILTQIILETERGGAGTLPAAFLHQLIKYGATWQDVMAKGLQATLGGIVSSQREADRIFRDWAARAGLSAPTRAPAPAAGEPSSGGGAERAGDDAATLKRKLRTLRRAVGRKGKKKPRR